MFSMPYLWSEWRDLNSRPLDPQSSALPTAPHPDMDFLTLNDDNTDRRLMQHGKTIFHLKTSEMKPLDEFVFILFVGEDEHAQKGDERIEGGDDAWPCGGHKPGGDRNNGQDTEDNGDELVHGVFAPFHPLNQYDKVNKRRGGDEKERYYVIKAPTLRADDKLGHNEEYAGGRCVDYNVMADILSDKNRVDNGGPEKPDAAGHKKGPEHAVIQQEVNQKACGSGDNGDKQQQAQGEVIPDLPLIYRINILP